MMRKAAGQSVETGLDCLGNLTKLPSSILVQENRWMKSKWNVLAAFVSVFQAANHT